ncbi:unnamed protein product [Lathyrus oleraceus]
MLDNQVTGNPSSESPFLPQLFLSYFPTPLPFSPTTTNSQPHSTPSSSSTITKPKPQGFTLHFHQFSNLL